MQIEKQLTHVWKIGRNLPWLLHGTQEETFWDSLAEKYIDANKQISILG